MKIEKEKSSVVLIDVQGKLAEIMHESRRLFDNLQILLRAAGLLEVPILWCEQNPQRLGPTLPELADCLKDQKPIAKMCFSCADSPDFMQALRAVGRPQVILAGIEAHICVTQTALDLLQAEFQVVVVADAVSSRSPHSREIALRRLEAAGATLVTVEMLLFEWLRTAEHPGFRQIARLIK